MVGFASLRLLGELDAVPAAKGRASRATVRASAAVARRVRVVVIGCSLVGRHRHPVVWPRGSPTRRGGASPPASLPSRCCLQSFDCCWPVFESLVVTSAAQ